MSKKRTGPPPIVYIAGAIAIAFLTTYFITARQQTSTSTNTSISPNQAGETTDFPPSFSMPTDVASDTIVKIGGATSMVQINEALKTGFTKQFPTAKIIATATGSDRGLTDLVSGSIDLAATSRALTAEEKTRGLVAVPIVKDAIAIVVSNTNPFRTGLTADKVEKIFTGQIQNWADIGGKSTSIRVINRPQISGTYQSFQTVVLKGNKFGTSANFSALDRDATTPLLQALKTDGISYATFAQVANQSTVRTIAIDGMTPESANYPYQRTLSYVYKNPPTEGVKAFLGFATSTTGQKLIPDRVPGK
jgi:phosphate transport system substrate-binding protein